MINESNKLEKYKFLHYSLVVCLIVYIAIRLYAAISTTGIQNENIISVFLVALLLGVAFSLIKKKELWINYLIILVLSFDGFFALFEAGKVIGIITSGDLLAKMKLFTFVYIVIVAFILWWKVCGFQFKVEKKIVK